MKYLATVAAACFGTAALADPFVVNVIQSPSTFDPAFACDIIGNGYVAPLYSPLISYARKDLPGPKNVTVTAEDDSQFVPGVAEKWEVSEDGLTYTFTIRDGMKFASGNAMDAAAVAASLNRALNSGGCSSYYLHGGSMGNTKSVTAEGNQVKVTLAAPQPLVMHTLTQPNLGIVDVAVAEANGGNDWMATHAAPSGPYILEDYKPGEKAVYKANPNYFGPAPLEPEVVVNFISDPLALLQEARNGAADVTIGLPKQMVSRVQAENRESAKLKVAEVPSPRFMIVGLPNKVAPFDNPAFREALSYAVPYEMIEQSIGFGYAKNFFGPFPPEFSTYTRENGAPRGFNLAKAKELLAESGVSGPVPLELTIREGSVEQEQVATILQGAWASMGVQAEITKLSAEDYAAATTSLEKKTAIVRFDGPSVADPAWLLSYDMLCESPYNQSNYCNSDAEALFGEAVAIPDISARQAKWDEIAKLWIADAPRIPVYADVFTAVLHKDVTAFDFAQDGPFDLQYWGR